VIASLTTLKSTVQNTVARTKPAQIDTQRNVDTKTNAEEEVPACIAMKKDLIVKL
jgi:hypothetical protein